MFELCINDYYFLNNDFTQLETYLCTLVTCPEIKEPHNTGLAFKCARAGGVRVEFKS